LAVLNKTHFQGKNNNKKTKEKQDARNQILLISNYNKNRNKKKYHLTSLSGKTFQSLRDDRMSFGCLGPKRELRL
jgi:hypothetical protein